MLSQDYRRSLEENISAMPGTAAMYYRNLESEESFSFNGAEPIMAASVIKLPIFLETLRLAEGGILSLDEEILCREEDKVGGCGALKAFPGEFDVPLRTLAELMITISDNTATNLIIDRVGLPELQRGFEAAGLIVTRLRRKLYDAQASAMGLQNTISVSEIGMLLEKLFRGEWVKPAVSEYALETLLRQQINHKIPGYIKGFNARIAHKTGEDSGISNDVGIVYAKQPFVLCFAAQGTDVPRWERFIRETSLEIFEKCGGAAEKS